MENSLDFGNEIRETAGLINLAGSWGLNEFIVFMAIFGFIGFVVVFLLLSRYTSKNTDLMIDVVNKNSEAINKQSSATEKLSDILAANFAINKEKLNEIHDDVREIKHSVKYTRTPRNKKFSEHITKGDME